MPKHKKTSLNLNHWEKQAKKYKKSHQVSWRDVNMMNLEIDAIRPYIKNKSYILDAGCSNGFSTIAIVKNKNVKVEAVDYSPTSIKQARKQKYNHRQINFSVGNVKKIDFTKNSFDLAFTIRVIINLPNWAEQKKAIKEIHRVLKPGGVYLLSEAFTGSLTNLNLLRKAARMEPLKVPTFNHYLNEKKFEKFIRQYFKIVEIKKFSSIYYVASRFLRYLAMEPGQADSYNNPINNYFAKLKTTENSEDFGIQKLYVLKKR